MSEHQTLDGVEHRLSEALAELYDRLVDPREAFYDADGAMWLPLGGEGSSGHPAFPTEAQHREIRNQCRALAATNEFAINGHENRISYIVGAGHSYHATPRKGCAPRFAKPAGQAAHAGEAAPVGQAARAGQAAPADRPPDEEHSAALAAGVQQVIDHFVRENRWRARQEEIVRRRDRDGEALLRLFLAPDGTTRVRFVEPGQVATPVELAGDAAVSFGIQTDRDDVEHVLAYWIDGEPVPAADIQHRKGNVDVNVKRGMPLFYPVRKNLQRAEKLLRNMSVLAEIQSAIALIRRHRGATAAGVQQFVAASADATRTDPAGGRTTHLKRYAPGTILDVHGGVEYDLPAASLDAGSYVAVLKAELRAIASRLVMPEFMLTSDASNANYASSLVAEGPAVKMFARLQAQMIEEDLEVLWRVVRHAVAAGKLPAAALDRVEIQVQPPSLAVRDTLAEVQGFQIELANGILSPQTWSQRRGLDYDQEQANRACHGRGEKTE
jgi:hypothetical protein